MAGSKLARFIARASMIAGLVVGFAAVAIWTFGFGAEPSPWWLRIAVAKFTLGIAVAMVGSGALVLRSLKEWERRGERRGGPLPNEAPRALGAPAWEPPKQQRAREVARRTTPPETPVP